MGFASNRCAVYDECHYDNAKCASAQTLKEIFSFLVG